MPSVANWGAAVGPQTRAYYKINITIVIIPITECSCTIIIITPKSTLYYSLSAFTFDTLINSKSLKGGTLYMIYYIMIKTQKNY